MVRRDNLHSSLVALFKVALPLVGLVLLSTLFLVSGRVDPRDATPADGLDVEERARAPRMTTPDYSGITSDGAALTLRAAEARPSTGPGVESSTTDLTAVLETPDGARTEVVAATGRIDGDLIVLEGDVVVTSSSGYRIMSDAMTTAMKETMIQSPGPITATSPMGNLSAGTMSLTEDAAADGDYLLVFQNGVKLVYEPK